MSTEDAEVVARLRASFNATAGRTPISADRLDEITIDPVGRRSNVLVMSLSAAAAVAVVGGVTAVVTSLGPGPSQVAVPGAAAGGSSVGTALPTVDPNCVPENYGVIASATEVAPFSYVLASVPSGFQLYGAWGVIDRPQCLDTTIWYVEYDKIGATPGDGDGAIQLMVTSATARRSEADALRQELREVAPSLVPSVSWSPDASIGVASSTPTPSSAPSSAPASSTGSQPSHAVPDRRAVAVAGTTGRFSDGKTGWGNLVWSQDGRIFELSAPISGDDPSSLVQLAGSLVHVAPSDPRIVPPPNCDVPAGQICSG